MHKAAQIRRFALILLIMVLVITMGHYFAQQDHIANLLNLELVYDEAWHNGTTRGNSSSISPWNKTEIVTSTNQSIPRPPSTSSHIIDFNSTNTNQNQPENVQYKVCILIAVTSKKSKWKSIQDSHLVQFPLFDLRRFSDPAAFNYSVYVGYDVGDAFFDRKDTLASLSAWFEAHVGKGFALSTLRFPNPLSKPGPVFNALSRRAYDDGCDYLYRINDDTRLLTTWTRELIGALQSLTPPNVGVVGPVCRQGNQRILTHDFVHRGHLDLFGTHYPPELTDYGLDGWISRVYGDASTARVAGVEVMHAALPTRYEIDHDFATKLPILVERGREALRGMGLATGDLDSDSKPPRFIHLSDHLPKPPDGWSSGGFEGGLRPLGQGRLNGVPIHFRPNSGPSIHQPPSRHPHPGPPGDLSRILSRLPRAPECGPVPTPAYDTRGAGPVVALASFPGSGNTWMRELLELSTGVLTGSSMPETPQLRRRFPGSGRANAQVVVVKTHCVGGRDAAHPLCGGGQAARRYDRAVLLVREPRGALRAEYNRRGSKSHVGHAPRDAFSLAEGSPWRAYVADAALRWRRFHEDAAARFAPRDRLVVFYDDLRREPERELGRVLAFLGREPVGREGTNRTARLRCAVLSAGQFKRPARPLSESVSVGNASQWKVDTGAGTGDEGLYDEGMLDMMEEARVHVFRLLGRSEGSGIGLVAGAEGAVGPAGER